MCASTLTKKQAKAKEWISSNSETLQALQKIVLSKNILNDLTHLTKFCHTRVLEAYHCTINGPLKDNTFLMLG